MAEFLNFAPYLLAFCRLTIIVVFIYAFVGKVRNVHVFEQSISDFNMLPSHLSPLIARIFLTAELVTVIALIVGGELLLFAFALAALLLCAFSIALILVLLRNMTISCNCFGPNQRQVSFYDVFRNTTFFSCSMLGIFVLRNSPYGAVNLPTIDLIMLLPIATTFVVVFTNLANLVRMFR